MDLLIALTILGVSIGFWGILWWASSRWLKRYTTSKINTLGGGFLISTTVFSATASLLILLFSNDSQQSPPPFALLPQSMEQHPTATTSQPPKIYRDGLPIEIVKQQLCQSGGIIEDCLMRKTAASAVSDLGWTMRDVTDGFIVEKEIQIEGMRQSTIYRWHVSISGFVKPINGHAISLTKN